MLRMGRRVSNDAKLNRVEEVLNEVNKKLFIWILDDKEKMNLLNKIFYI